MSSSCEVTKGVNDTWATCPTLLRGIWARRRRAGFRCCTVFDFKLTFSFLVVEMVVSICILSGDGGWQVRDVDVEEKGRQDRSLRDDVLEASWPASFAVSGGEGEPAVANHLHDHVNHVSIRQHLQKLAGEVAMPYSAVGCCEVDRHSSCLLFSWKAILDVLCRQGDLVYGRPPGSQVCLLPREQWVDDWVDTSVDEALEGLKGTHSRDMGQ